MTIYNAYLQVRESPRERRRKKKIRKGEKKEEFSVEMFVPRYRAAGRVRLRHQDLLLF